ncbi:Uncharacterised protein at_DN0067 [Pycnogonum litorale]
MGRHYVKLVSSLDYIDWVSSITDLSNRPPTCKVIEHLAYTFCPANGEDSLISSQSFKYTLPVFHFQHGCYCLSSQSYLFRKRLLTRKLRSEISLKLLLECTDITFT